MGVIMCARDIAQTMETSGTWTVPVDGIYRIVCVGAGGPGGRAGDSHTGDSGCRVGASGGGGGAGQMVMETRELTAGTVVSIIVGSSGASGMTAFGTVNDDFYITALGGGAGGDGETAPLEDRTTVTRGGHAGLSHGSPAEAGADGRWHSVIASGSGGKGGESVFSPYGDGGNGASAGTVATNAAQPHGAVEAEPGHGGCVQIGLLVATSQE